MSPAGMPAPSASRATRQLKSSGNISRDSTAPKTRKPAALSAHWRLPPGKDVSRAKAGGSARTASKFWASVVIDPIRGTDGVILGFAKITRDITERKQAERELEQAREALFQSQKMDAVGQLTGGVAHDFNNLLSAVLGSLELLRKRLPDDPKMLRLLDNAVHGAQRGALLTQRMLAFARRQDLKPGRRRCRHTRARK